ncbi:hypothetical protein EXS71_03755 [Candidatus Uhrbacteria bacterium]|nr:hypothetical protein [Candidatus Uhrbacteria bacterium]
MALESFGDFVKAVVDIEKNLMVIGGELHADEEQVLLEQGSRQEDLWGINLYPNQVDESWIEFDSMINIRPRQGNRSRSVDDVQTREQIIRVVNKLIQK